MAPDSKRLAHVRDALEIVRGRLSALPASQELVELRELAGTCIREVARWSNNPPSAEQCERVMKLVVRLHAAVATLESEALPSR